MGGPQITSIWWAVGLVVVLPIAVVALSELQLSLRRRGNALARPVNLLRIWLLPLTALFLILTRASDISSDNAGVRVVATLVGVLAVTVALGGLNAVLFGNATEGTWRDRLPSIFIDLARLILVATGAAAVAAYVWGLNVSGLFAALGVGSIVIGLALQTAIGSVVSGLLLLFEQPFRIGDTLDVGGVQGKVIEMNWRSTHVDIGSGIQIIPNATIAGASFANLSRPSAAYDLVIDSSFASSDAPHRVAQTLRAVASGLPMLRPDAEPVVRVLGAGSYSTMIPLMTAGDAGSARTAFLTWLWYASRRDEISLDGETFEQHPREDVVAALRDIATTLDIDPDSIDELADECELEQYGRGEHLVRAGQVPERVAVLVGGGRGAVTAPTTDGAVLAVREIDRGEVVGVSGYLREPSPVSLTAITEVDVLQIPLEVVDRLVADNATVARRFADLATAQHKAVAKAVDEVNRSPGVLTAVRLGPAHP